MEDPPLDRCPWTPRPARPVPDQVGVKRVLLAVRRAAYAAALSLLGCEDEADEAAQEVLVALWETGPLAILAIRSPEAYGRTAGRRRALNRLRAGRSFQVGEVRVDRLPERCRAVLTAQLHGRSRNEIALALGISLKAVEWQIGEGRRRIAREVALRFPGVPPGELFDVELLFPDAAEDLGGG